MITQNRIDAAMAARKDARGRLKVSRLILKSVNQGESPIRVGELSQLDQDNLEDPFEVWAPFMHC